MSTFMPSGPGDVPFQPFASTDLAPADDAAPPEAPGALHTESILLQAFNRANVAAYQAKGERARTFNLYFFWLGATVSAMATLETIYVLHPLHVLTIVAILAGLLGAAQSYSFFVRLYTLGIALRDSAISMRVIEDYYIQQLKRESPDLEQTLHWRLSATGDEERSGRIPFVMALTVALSGSLFLSLVVYLILALRELLTLAEGTFVQTTPYDMLVIALTFIIGLAVFVVLNAALVLRYAPARGHDLEARN